MPIDYSSQNIGFFTAATRNRWQIMTAVMGGNVIMNQIIQ